MKPIREASVAVVDSASCVALHVDFSMPMDETAPSSRATLLAVGAAVVLLVVRPAVVPIGEATVAINVNRMMNRHILVDDLWWQVDLAWHKLGVIHRLGMIDGVRVRTSNARPPAAVETLGMGPSMLPILDAMFAVVGM